ncbi:hypothetical protein KSU07_11035 [Fusobacterium animalis]|uniref:hypothetical protein n=1 Tax=Fusobacterium animalis TaxID=76859 RepID=UPI0030CF021B
MDNISQRKKYLEELLIEVGFLKKEDNQWENEKDKMCKRKHKVLEYSDKIKNEFLNFIVDLKENYQEKLIINKLRKEEEKKSKNHKFYDDLFKEGFDVDKMNFYFILLNKIEEISHYKDLKMKYLEETKFDKELRKNNTLLMFREFIRDSRIILENVREDFYKISYLEKMEIIRIDMEFIHYSGLEECKFWLEELIEDKYRQLLCYDVFQQLIVYDIITDRIPEIEREKNYKKMCEFLDSFLDSLKYNQEKPLKVKKDISKIFIDFFSFIILREELVKNKEILDIEESIKNHICKEIKPLDKKVLFFNHLLEMKKKQEETNYEDINIGIINFIELEEIKDKIDRDTLTISLNKCKNLIEDFKLTQKDKSEIIYGKAKINKFNEKQEDLETIISAYPFFSKKSLQVKKAIVSNIENDTSLILPFRKTLKELIKDENLRESETVIKHIRMRITKGLYEEKNNLKGFQMSINLERKINDIFFKIYSFKDRKFREEYMNKFINYFFDSLISINKEKIILTTKEGKEIAKEIKAYKGLDKELDLKEMYNICKYNTCKIFN